MKFDYVVGNPPYQIETAKKETDNGQKTSKRIFGEFQTETESIAKNICLIYPAMGWILGSSKGLKEFGYNQINDVHLKALKVFKNAIEVFPGVGIGDGISIVLKDMERERETFNYTFVNEGKKTTIQSSHPGDEVFITDPNQTIIIDKIKKFVSDNNLCYLKDTIQPRKLFGVESNFVEENPDKVRLYHNGDTLADNEIRLYANDKAGKAGKTTWFITNRNNIPQGQDLIDKYKVIVSSANLVGDSRDRQLELLEPKTAFGRSRICLKTFDTKQEADVFMKYVSCDLIRFAFLVTGGLLTVAGKVVPDILNYKTETVISLTEDFDKSFQKILGLTNEEVKYIHDFVDANTYHYKNEKEV